MIHGFNDLCAKSKHYEFTCGIKSDNHSRLHSENNFLIPSDCWIKIQFEIIVGAHSSPQLFAVETRDDDKA